LFFFYYLSFFLIFFVLAGTQHMKNVYGRPLCVYPICGIEYVWQKYSLIYCQKIHFDFIERGRSFVWKNQKRGPIKTKIKMF